jgi:ectoine hydroxylase-related dioxygenase (phytanoyl-CoA dioxygenase family)
MNYVVSFGVKEFQHSSTDVERAVEEIAISGYSIIPNVLDSLQLRSIREKLELIYRKQIDEIGGEDQLRLINDAFTVRCPLLYDEEFLRVATNPRVLQVVEAILGDYFTLMLQNGVLNYPVRGTQQNAAAWHRDLNYQHFVSSRPLSISALFCIDPFTRETGGTHVLPASQKTEKFPSVEYVRAHETLIEAAPGSVLIFDSMMFHRGGLNTSSDVRCAINHMFSLPLIKPQISLARALSGKYADDPFLRKLLGYDSEPGDNALQWRQVKIAQARRK